ncbi:peptidylprolyl isomerase [Chitinophaga silvatica]|uniref:Peptidyl-prolyl cis-trans isomerase n=1 Tax=Chitinophaga silvatica TaxID=2282649 RepID=A0A3E1Y6N1_9BACT|nr:FKBP-type peptidyl-prolyl cis-trans isomerase [Chitinophaga silvatica]RFS20590.1 peptidylprolyl isomerase [Chitinophaga silvatica]
MKKFLLLGTGVALTVMAACSKKDSGETYDAIAQYNIDSVKIENYIKENNILDVKHDTGSLWYQIVKPGSDAKPNGVASVKLGYKGTLLNKTQFDGKDTANFDLDKVIPGFSMGIRKIGKDGEVNIFIPSYFGYGPYKNGSIPANSPLIFNVKLYEFTNK